MLAVLTVNIELDNNFPGDDLVTLREAIIAANENSVTDLEPNACRRKSNRFRNLKNNSQVARVQSTIRGGADRRLSRGTESTRDTVIRR